MLGKLFKRKDIAGAGSQTPAPGDIVRQLTADGNLSEARRAGEQAVAADPSDDDAVSALIEVYLALEMQCVETGVHSFLPEITKRVNELLPQLATSEDRLRERHNEIVRKSLPGYRRLKEFENQSALPGHERQAYEDARKFISDSNTDARLLPIYATIISRYLRVLASEVDSLPARHLLAEYLSLPVTRPSRVHSLILRQAVRMARIYPDFKFGRFLELWDTATFLPGDLNDHDNKVPLAVTAFETLIESDDVDRLPSLLSRLPVNDDERLGILRETFAHIVSKYTREGDRGRAADMLTLYSRHVALHKPCRHHSMILEMAIKNLCNDLEWQFPEFFINWGAENFTLADFNPLVRQSGDVIPSIACRALQRCYNIVHADVERYSYLLNRFLDTVDTMIRLCPGKPDELLKRRRAGIVSMLDRPDLALDCYAEMAREDGHGAEFWTEYADLVADHHLKASIFALAIVKGQMTAKDIARVKLYLARELHFNDCNDEATALLDDYQENVTAMAAEPLPVYGAIRNIIPPDTAPHAVNETLYHTLATDALDFIYGKVPTRLLSVLRSKADSLIASDSAEQFSIDTLAWPLLSRLVPGDNIRVKIVGSEIVLARRAVEDTPYCALRRRHAIVLSGDRIQCSSNSDPIDCPDVSRLGRYVSVAIYRDNEGNRYALEPHQAFVADVRRDFEHITGALYAMDDQFGYYTSDPGEMCGSVTRNLCDGLAIGQPCDFYYYNADDKQVVFSITEAINPDDCRAVKEVSGPLTLASGGDGDVRGVSVAREMILPDMAGAYVKVQAVYHPGDPRLGTPGTWHAVTISLYR